jgi:hypothetical protein
VPFHEDHVFPKSLFTRRRLLDAGIAEEVIPDFQDKVNRLPNLQLLEGPVNVAKLATLPAQWAETAFANGAERNAYLAFHDLDELPTDLTEFDVFYARRRNLMQDRLRALLIAPEPR